MQRIVAAAIRDEGTGLTFSLPAPARHHDVLRAMTALGLDAMKIGHPDAQGFLTDTGRFLGRIGAACCAIDAGQIDALKFNARELFSEDLW
ncbi:hypothetical protein [uncultured Mameliella sp.]|uniref:hypothetical protein n=1 Tax=uncultured Mameliella sp. TaxID=1447087 RepID=UPI00262E8A46|nr:hypothetical protein [uncultured Mameliella sp.]